MMSTHRYTTRRAQVWLAALMGAALIAMVGLLLARSGPADAAAGSTATHKACDTPISLFAPGDTVGGLRLTAVERVCSQPEPTPSQAAGGKVDPDSLVRSNFMTFLYGDCVAEPGSGCAFPIEVQVWPACERNPASFATPTAKDPEDRSGLGPDERNGGPKLLATPQVRGTTTYVYGDTSGETSKADVSADPIRVEAVIGNSTVVVFSDGSSTTAAGGERARLLDVISRLAPAGTSEQPAVQTATASAGRQALPAPAAGATDGLLTCNGQ